MRTPVMERVTKGFLVEIDGNKHAFYDDLDSAKKEATHLSKGVSSMKITSFGPGAAPCSAWHWDYEINDWVFCENAVFAEAKRKDK